MRQLSVILIAVTGQTLVLLIGGIDLSMGATIGLASVCGAFTMHYMDSSLLGLLACLATGIAIGALNGFGAPGVGVVANLKATTTDTLTRPAKTKAAPAIGRGGFHLPLDKIAYISASQTPCHFVIR